LYSPSPLVKEARKTVSIAKSQRAPCNISPMLASVTARRHDVVPVQYYFHGVPVASVPGRHRRRNGGAMLLYRDRHRLDSFRLSEVPRAVQVAVADHVYDTVAGPW
jgi:hypothetical protein